MPELGPKPVLKPEQIQASSSLADPKLRQSPHILRPRSGNLQIAAATEGTRPESETENTTNNDRVLSADLGVAIIADCAGSGVGGEDAADHESATSVHSEEGNILGSKFRKFSSVLRIPFYKSTNTEVGRGEVEVFGLDDDTDHDTNPNEDWYSKQFNELDDALDDVLKHRLTPAQVAAREAAVKEAIAAREAAVKEAIAAREAAVKEAIAAREAAVKEAIAAREAAAETVNAGEGNTDSTSVIPETSVSIEKKADPKKSVPIISFFTSKKTDPKNVIFSVELEGKMKQLLVDEFTEITAEVKAILEASAIEGDAGIEEIVEQREEEPIGEGKATGRKNIVGRGVRSAWEKRPGKAAWTAWIERRKRAKEMKVAREEKARLEKVAREEKARLEKVAREEKAAARKKEEEEPARREAEWREEREKWAKEMKDAREKETTRKVERQLSLWRVEETKKQGKAPSRKREEAQKKRIEQDIKNRAKERTVTLRKNAGTEILTSIPGIG